eukprot:6186235-Pleurochrysis_carterae.AAC.1
MLCSDSRTLAAFSPRQRPCRSSTLKVARSAPGLFSATACAFAASHSFFVCARALAGDLRAVP